MTAEKLDFRPYIKVYLDEKASSVTLNRPFVDGNDALVFELSDVGLLIFESIDGTYSQEDILQKVIGVYPESREEATQIIDFLLSEKYIEEIKEQNEYIELASRFERIIPLWAEFENENFNRYNIQELITQKNVGIIGCGTVGFSILSKLVASGVKNFVLYDSDIVEISNLSRQPLFSMKDLGRYKVDVAKKFVEDRWSDSNVIVKNNALLGLDDLSIMEKVDIIIVAGDYPSYTELGLLVQKFCFEKMIPMSFAGGYRGFQGRIYPLVIPGQTYCFDCLAKYLHRKSEWLGKRIANRKVIVSTNAQMADFIASIGASEVLKYLSGVIPLHLVNKYMTVNFLTYQIVEEAFEKDTDCCYCQNIRKL